VEGVDFALQIVDVEIRPTDHPENAAIKYNLRFINTSPRPVQVEMNLADIQGIDPQGATYGDYWVLANRFATAQCANRPTGARYQEQLVIQLPAQGVKQFDFYLGRSDAEGSCAEHGAARSRVPIGAAFVDVQIGRTVYTSDRRRELPGAWWRLSR
jgi:hypothetical protein